MDLCAEGDASLSRDQRASRDLARTERTALIRIAKAVINFKAMIVLYRLMWRVERVVIAPLLLQGALSAEAKGYWKEPDPGIEIAPDAVRHHDHNNRQRIPVRPVKLNVLIGSCQ